MAGPEKCPVMQRLGHVLVRRDFVDQRDGRSVLVKSRYVEVLRRNGERSACFKVPCRFAFAVAERDTRTNCKEVLGNQDCC